MAELRQGPLRLGRGGEDLICRGKAERSTAAEMPGTALQRHSIGPESEGKALNNTAWEMLNTGLLRHSQGTRRQRIDPPCRGTAPDRIAKEKRRKALLRHRIAWPCYATEMRSYGSLGESKAGTGNARAMPRQAEKRTAGAQHSQGIALPGTAADWHGGGSSCIGCAKDCMGYASMGHSSVKLRHRTAQQRHSQEMDGSVWQRDCVGLLWKSKSENSIGSAHRRMASEQDSRASICRGEVKQCSTLKIRR